jgi:hypothetical protein
MSEAGTPGNGLTSEQMRDVIRGLSSADTVDSPFGRLEFFDGLPRPDTVSAVYDARSHGWYRGFLNAVPGASLVAMRRGMRSAGITSPRVIGSTDPRANSRHVFLTPNTEAT